MGRPEGICHCVERRKLVRLSDGDAKPPPRFVKVKLEEGAARPLNTESLLERVAIEDRIELEHNRLGFPFQVRHARGKVGIAGVLVPNPRLIEGATRNCGDRLIKRIVRRLLRCHDGLLKVDFGYRACSSRLEIKCPKLNC
jgi:hypothetical protein